MKRVLETDLHIGFGIRVDRYSRLHTLKIKEIERISDLIQELHDTCWVDTLLLVKPTIDLKSLYWAKGLLRKVFKRYYTLLIQLELLIEITPYAIEIEHRMFRQMLGAVTPKCTFIWFVTLGR